MEILLDSESTWHRPGVKQKLVGFFNSYDDQDSTNLCIVEDSGGELSLRCSIESGKNLLRMSIPVRAIKEGYSLLELYSDNPLSDRRTYVWENLVTGEIKFGDGEEASVVLPIKAMVSASQPHSILIIGNRFSEFNEFGESSFDYVFRLSTGTGGTPECRRFGRWLVSHHSKVRALLEYDYRPLFTRGTKRKVGYDPTSLSNYQVFLDLARKIHKFRSWIQDKAGVLPKCRKRDLVL